MKIVIKDIYLNVKYPKNLHDLHSIYHSYQKEWKLINVTSLYVICMITKAMLFI